MNEYILQFTTGEKFRISKAESEAIARTPDDKSITIQRLGMVVQKRMAQIYPAGSPIRPEDRKGQQTGVLHDGTKAKRHFGRWVDYGHTVPDDDEKKKSMRYVPIELDLEYYPEVALDCVATETEFETIKKHNLNYYKFLKIDDQRKRLPNNSGMTHIGEIARKSELLKSA